MDNVLPPVTVYSDNTEPADTGVSLSPPSQDPDTGVTLGNGVPTVSVPEGIADVRAKKVQEGLGPIIKKSTDDIKREISEGREEGIRKEAAANMDYMRTIQKQKMLIDMANAKGGALDETEVAKVLEPFNQPTDPNSVVEKAYSKAYINSIQGAIDSVKSTPLQDAQKEIPEQVEVAKEKGTVLKEKMEFAAKIKDDIGIMIKNQSWPGYLADQGKSMVQIYNEAKMRGQNSDVGVIAGGILLGDNLQEQADKLFGLPLDQFKSKLKDITTIIAHDNPSLAYRFSEYVEGLPRTDRILDNTFTIMAIPDVLGLSKLGLNIARKISLRNRTNIAMKSLVKTGDDIQASKVSRSEALGDVPTATVERATENILKDLDGTSNPVQFATNDSLLTIMKQSRDKLETNPGSLSREQVVRIQDAYDASGKSILQRLVDTVRINRIPMAVATQNAVRIIKDAVKDYYPGIRNAILDVSNPLYESKSNTYWHEITFGNIGGDLFSNPKTAENFAKLHGWNDVRIEEGYGKVTPVQTENMLKRRTQLETNVKEADLSIDKRKLESKDKTLTDAERKVARDEADALLGHKNRFIKEIDDLNLKLKNKQTYDRVKQLEAETAELQSTNKALRASSKKEKDPNVKAHLDESVKFGEANILARKQETNAIRTGTAEVRGGTTVEQHGVGFKIVVRRPLVETDKAVRDLMIRDASGKLIPEATSTSSQTGLKALMNWGLGRFRGADDTLALNESIQRKIGTYSKSLFEQWANDEAKYIRQIATGVIRQDEVTGAPIPYWRAKPTALWNKATLNTRKSYNEFTRTLDYARDATDPITGKPGYFFETPGQLENFYLKNFDRQPTFAEHQAYNAFVRMVEGDRIFREVAEFRNRARLGVEQFSISFRGPDGKAIKSDFFDAVSKKVFPGGDDVLMVMGRRKGDEKIYNLGGAAISQAQLTEWRKAVQQGQLRVLEVFASEHTPLRDFSDVAANNHVRYILTDAADSKPIDFNHVNRRGGGHFEYDYEHYIKQAKMYHQYEEAPGVKGKYKSVYYGDTTFMPIDNRVMGADIAKKLGVIQKLIREGELDEAKRFTEAHLPIEWDELHGMFKEGRDSNGKVTPPQLDLHEPFVTVPRGKTILDTADGKDLRARYGTPFKDGTKSGSLNSQFQTAFNTERDSAGLRTFEDKGTQGNPLYRYAPDGAKMVDPITTMNRSLNRIINSTVMDDYKMYAVEHWLREASAHMELKEDQIRSSPFWAFTQANDKSAFISGTPPEVIANLLSNRNKIMQFTGLPNSTQTAIHAATQWLVDTAYKSYGPVESRTLGQKAITLIPEWLLAHATDPITFMRTMTFHAKLGLFSPAQLLVQMQTYAAIASISPFHGTAGTYAAMLHGWASINGSKEILKGMDNMATKLSVFGQSRWRPGEFLEANQVLGRTGFANVAGEYANLNTALNHNFFTGDAKAILKAGAYFFEKGEQSTRVGAWYTAFREFREVNPSKALTRDDIGKILQRADLLTINMSRASNSSLHTGVLSLSTQFISYQLRMAELFMGSRLGGTTTERMMARGRLLTFYAALYGAPSAIGLTGLPMSNNIRQEAMQRGYVVGDNWIKTAIDLGLPATTLALMTGNTYNVGDRYGSPGFTQFNDALKSDHAWYQLLAGASGTVLLNTLTAGNNFFHVMGSMFNPSNKDKAFPLKMDDFVSLFKEISSVNQSWKVIMAINTGKWMSKNEAYIGDVSKANALFMSLTGLSPQAQDDLYLKNNIRKSEVEMQKYVLKTFIQEYRRGMQAAKDKNPEQAKDFYTRAFTLLELGGYPMEKKATAISLAVKNYESQIDSNDYAFAFKNVPKSRSDFMGIPTPFTTQTNIPETRREQFRTQEKLTRESKQP